MGNSVDHSHEAFITLITPFPLIARPVSPLAVASMLACVRIGALHNVVFAGFSAEALAGRYPNL